MNDLKELNKLVGEEFNADDVICAMTELDEPVIVDEVEGYTSNFEGYGECKLYNAYYDEAGSDMYEIWVNDNKIVYVN